MGGAYWVPRGQTAAVEDPSLRIVIIIFLFRIDEFPKGAVARWFRGVRFCWTARRSTVRRCCDQENVFARKEPVESEALHVFRAAFVRV